MLEFVSFCFCLFVVEFVLLCQKLEHEEDDEEESIVLYFDLLSFSREWMFCLGKNTSPQHQQSVHIEDDAVE